MRFLFICIPFLLLSACSHTLAPVTVIKTTVTAPDYSQLSNWAAHPWKWDPSDSIPRPLRLNTATDSAADVFFIHPTSFLAEDRPEWNAAINDEALNQKTDYSSILYQASAFHDHTRVFAPRYRQAHYRSFFTDDHEAAARAFDTAYADVKRAFLQYLTLNAHRPLIIAAHSQGTLHAVRLLKEFFDGNPLAEQLVAAYLIGMPVPEKTFTSIPVCTDSTQTGCYVSWRTYRQGYIDTLFVSKENFKASVVNPLTWDTSSVYAPRNLNSGGILKKFNKLKKGVVDAQIHQNVLWTSKPRFFGNIFLRQKNYHIGDINLFYNNIRINLEQRIRHFLSRH